MTGSKSHPSHLPRPAGMRHDIHDTDRYGTSIFLNLYIFSKKNNNRSHRSITRRKAESSFKVSYLNPLMLFCLGHLSVHSAALHAFHADAHTCLLDLALLLLLAVLEVTTMTKLHEMAGLVDLTLELAEGLLDGLTVTDLHLDGDGKGGGGGGSGG